MLIIECYSISKIRAHIPLGGSLLHPSTRDSELGAAWGSATGTRPVGRRKWIMRVLRGPAPGEEAQALRWQLSTGDGGDAYAVALRKCHWGACCREIASGRGGCWLRVAVWFGMSPCMGGAGANLKAAQPAFGRATCEFG
jgi:hypothetical protein